MKARFEFAAILPLVVSLTVAPPDAATALVVTRGPFEQQLVPEIGGPGVHLTFQVASSSGGPARPWQPSESVLLRVSPITFDFSEVSPSVVVSSFTLELGPIRARAMVPVSVTQDVSFFVESGAFSVESEEAEQPFLLAPDGTVRFSLVGWVLNPPQQSILFDYTTPLGPVSSPIKAAHLQLDLLFETRDVGNAPLILEAMHVPLEPQAIGGLDPVTGATFDAVLNPPFPLHGLGPLREVPELGSAVLLASGLLAVFWARSRACGRLATQVAPQ